MKRPPDKKLLLGALVLLVAASAFASRPDPAAMQKEVVFLRAH